MQEEITKFFANKLIYVQPEKVQTETDDFPFPNRPGEVFLYAYTVNPFIIDFLKTKIDSVSIVWPTSSSMDQVLKWGAQLLGRRPTR